MRQSRLPVLGAGAFWRDRVDVVGECQRHDVGFEAVDDAARLRPEPPCEAVGAQFLAGSGQPLFRERGVDLGVELSRRIVRHVEQRGLRKARCGQHADQRRADDAGFLDAFASSIAMPLLSKPCARHGKSINRRPKASASPRSAGRSFRDDVPRGRLVRLSSNCGPISSSIRPVNSLSATLGHWPTWSRPCASMRATRSPRRPRASPRPCRRESAPPRRAPPDRAHVDGAAIGGRDARCPVARVFAVADARRDQARRCATEPRCVREMPDFRSSRPAPR